jgi:transcription termination/antitermination protein NusG
MAKAKKTKANSEKKAALKKPAKKPAKKTKKKQKIKAPTKNHIVINTSDDKKANWYVVHTYSGHEQKVANALKQRVEAMGMTNNVLELLIPTQNKIRVSKGKKLNVAEKIFPGYLLIKMILTDNSWLTVRTTTGITGFVGVGNKPTPLPEEEVKTILKFMQMEAPKYKASFSVGEAVKIIEGPFADFLGTVEHIDEEKGKVRVLVSIFGRETPVELDLLQASKI